MVFIDIVAAWILTLRRVVAQQLHLISLSPKWQLTHLCSMCMTGITIKLSLP